MSFAVTTVDEKGRIVIPSKIRRKLNLKKGDSVIILEYKGRILILTKPDVERMLKELAEAVSKSGLDFDMIEAEIEEEANKLAREKIHDRH